MHACRCTCWGTRTAWRLRSSRSVRAARRRPSWASSAKRHTWCCPWTRCAAIVIVLAFVCWSCQFLLLARCCLVPLPSVCSSAEGELHDRAKDPWGAGARAGCHGPRAAHRERADAPCRWPRAHRHRQRSGQPRRGGQGGGGREGVHVQPAGGAAPARHRHCALHPRGVMLHPFASTTPEVALSSVLPCPAVSVRQQLGSDLPVTHTVPRRHTHCRGRHACCPPAVGFPVRVRYSACLLLHVLCMQVADFVLTSDICVERKAVPDLISSLDSGRLYSQAVAMCRHYKTPVLLIEFDPKKAFALQSMSDMGTEIRGSNVMSKLVILLHNFPKLRYVISCIRALPCYSSLSAACGLQRVGHLPAARRQ